MHLEGLLGQAIEENSSVISAVICKACCVRGERLHKTLESIQEIKIIFKGQKHCTPVVLRSQRQSFERKVCQILHKRHRGCRKEYLSLQEIMMRSMAIFKQPERKYHAQLPSSLQPETTENDFAQSITTSVSDNAN